MEGVALDPFNKMKPSTIPMAQLHYNVSDESDQDDSITATHLSIIIKSLLKKGLIYPFLTTMWDHRCG